MSKVEYKNIPLNDLFTPKNGNSKYTKAYCNKNKGKYPLYSASTEEEFSFINRYDYDGQYITWAKDGFAGYLMVNEGKFSITGHRGILIPNEIRNDIDINYIKFILEPIFRNAKKGREGALGRNEYTTINPDMIIKLNIKIPIPINAKGIFDIDKQRELANIYYEINDKKQKLLGRIKEIENLSVFIDIEKDVLFKEEQLNKIFDFSISTNSGLTKSYVNSNKGSVPVYGASQDPNEASYGYIKDNLENVKYFDDCLTYNKDGTSGKVFFRKGHFTISEKVVPLIPFENIKGTLDYTYLKYVIENIARKKDYTFSNKATKVSFKTIKIPIPIKSDGSFDLEKQKEIANKYRQIYEIKQGLIDKIKSLVEIKVVPCE